MSTDAYASIDEGTTKKIGAAQVVIGADTVLQWKVVMSEPFLAAYTISPAAALSTAVAASHLLQIMAGSSLRAILRRLLVTQMVGAGASTQGQFELRRLTSAGTGGTVITPALIDPVDAAAGATAMSLPTVKGTEGALVMVKGGTLLATPATAGAIPVFDYEWDGDRTKSIAIAAGTSNGLCLKNVTAIATATVHIYAEIVELSWS